MKTRKRMLALILTGAMMLAAAGCGNGPAESGESRTVQESAGSGAGENTGTGEASGSGEETPAEKITISVLIGEHASFPVTQFEDSRFLQYIEEKTGVRLELQPVPDAGNAYKDRINTLLATGDLPDVIWTSSNDASVNEVASKGAFLAYTDYLDVAPNIKKIIEENPDVRRSYLAGDGKLYIMPRITPNVMSEIFMIREDIMEKEQLEEPETFDDLYEMLKTLHERYPDAVTFINRNGGTHLVNRLAYTWGCGYETATNGFYLDRESNSYKYGPLDANFKAMVEWLKKLYDEGILDKEYALRSTAQWEEAYNNENAIFSIDYIDRVRSINDLYIQNGSEARVAAMKMPEGPTGRSGILAKSAAMANSGIVINSKVENPEAVVKFVDWIYSEEGRYTTAYGIEGETYEIDPQDGRPYYTEQMKTTDNPEGRDMVKDFGWVYYMDKYEFVSGYLKPAPGSAEGADNRWVFSREKAEENGEVIPADPVLNYTEEQAAIIRTKGVAVTDHFAANIDKFIMGTRPMSEWETFVQELESYGVAELEKVYNDAYKDFLSK